MIAMPDENSCFGNSVTDGSVISIVADIEADVFEIRESKG